MPTLCPEFHEAGVDGEPVEPGAEIALATEFLNGSGHLDKDIHQYVFGLVPVLEHPEGEIQHMAAMFLPEHGKSFAAAAFQAVQDTSFVHSAIWMCGGGGWLQKNINFAKILKNAQIIQLEPI